MEYAGRATNRNLPHRRETLAAVGRREMSTRSDRIVEYARGYLPRHARQRFREPGFVCALVTLYVTIGLSFGIVAVNVAEGAHLISLAGVALVMALPWGFAIGAAREWSELQEGKFSPNTVERISAAGVSIIYLVRMVPIKQAWAWIEQYRNGADVFVMKWGLREPLHADFSVCEAAAFCLLAWISLLLMVYIALLRRVSARESRCNT